MRVFAEDVMPVRCSGCAYTEGTEAHGDELTTLTRELCEMGGATFYCHANAVRDVLPADKRVCRGYADATLTQTIVGKAPQPWKRQIAQRALREMEIAEDRVRAGLVAERSEVVLARLLGEGR